MQDRTYEVHKTSNGFIVRFSHKDRSYDDINKAVAKNLKEVVEVIQADLDIDDDE